MKKWVSIALSSIALTMVALVFVITTNEVVYGWVNSFPVESLAYYASDGGLEQRVVPTLIDGLLHHWNHPVPKIYLITYFIDHVVFEFVKEQPWLSVLMVMIMMASTIYAWVMEYNAKNTVRTDIDIDLSEVRSRLIRYWLVGFGIAIIASAITLNFDINFMTEKWGIRFNGGASLPTSPYLPWQGRVVEYYHHLSIKDFLINNTWSFATTALVSIMAVWCAIKAHVATTKAVNESVTLTELLTVPLAAILGLLIAVFAPYRVHFSRESKPVDHKYDDWMTRDAIWTLPIPSAWKVKLEESYQNSDGALYLLRDRHASYIQRVLRVANKEINL